MTEPFFPMPTDEELPSNLQSLFKMTPADINTLTDVGLTKEEVWDVIELASMYAFTNRMALATAMMPNREYHFLAR